MAEQRQRAEQLTKERWHQNGRERQYREARHRGNAAELNELDARWNSDVETALDEIEDEDRHPEGTLHHKRLRAIRYLLELEMADEKAIGTDEAIHAVTVLQALEEAIWPDPPHPDGRPHINDTFRRVRKIMTDGGYGPRERVFTTHTTQ